jgi:hypothetical protein
MTKPEYVIRTSVIRAFFWFRASRFCGSLHELEPHLQRPTLLFAAIHFRDLREPDGALTRFEGEGTTTAARGHGDRFVFP